MSTYFSILTEIGEAKIANALALGVPLKLTALGVGDGNGIVPVPDRKQTALIREQRRAPINTLDKDPKNASQIIIEQVLPADVGGWWVREIGIYDETGDLCAVANCPPSYKPVIAEGAGKDQVVRVVLIVAGTAAVELKIDPAVVLATRKYADDAIVLYAAPKNHTHEDLAPLKSPAFTGVPLAPTPANGAATKQIVNIEYLAQAIATAMSSVDLSALALKNGSEQELFKVAKATLAAHAVNLGMFTTGQILSASAGMQSLPGGLILQWGITGPINPTSTVLITFPTTFPSFVGPVLFSRANSSSAQRTDVVQNLTTSNFSLNNGSPDSASTFRWLALGF